MAPQPNASEWKALFEAVKDDCLVGLWSKGVSLSRDGNVSGESEDGEEYTFRVTASGKLVAPTVRLYPADAEWECDCGSQFDPCEHVAACAIAACSGDAAVDDLFGGASANGYVRYELEGGDTGLRLTRYLVGGGGERELTVPLTDLVARGSSELDFAPTHEDLRVDRVIAREIRREIRPPGVAGFLRAMVGVTGVSMDGREVSVSAEAISPAASVVDAEGGSVELLIEADPQVERVAAPGVLRVGDTLHPVAAADRFGWSWEKLPLRRRFGVDRIGELVAGVLPELRRYAAVDVRTDRLPERAGKQRPWIRFEIDYNEEGLDVLPLMVYGDPPCARIDSDRLVHLGGEVPLRDKDAEVRLRLRLREELNLVPGRRVNMSGEDGAQLIEKLERFEDGRGPGRAAATAEAPDTKELSVRLVVDGDRVDVAFVSEDGDEPAVAAETAAAAWRDRMSLVPLIGGGFGRLPADWLGRHGALLSEFLAARSQNEGQVPPAAADLVAELCDALDQPEPMPVAGLRALLAGADASGPDETVLCPDLRGELRGYQRDGVAWLARLRDAGLGGVLADDMGLGKTVQAIAVLQAPSLVVCPKSVVHNWARELETFRPGLTLNLFHGPGRALDDSDVTLTTYATMRNDIEAISDRSWEVAVLDEAQAIKNPNSQSARAAFRLDAGFKLSLSGTPVENRLDELWSQMHFCNRGLLGGRSDFGERYGAPIADGNPEAAERLRGRISPFVLRRLKREVATDLPPRTDSVMICELEDGERAAYDAIVAATRRDVLSQLGESGNVLAALEALLRLRQAACHPALLPGGRAESSSKVDALCESLDDVVADGHKALVFSQWTGMLDLIEPRLRAHDIAFSRLDGKTRDRAAVVDGFQGEDGAPVLLISLTAGGTGLNLTAADHVFLMDPWWNPAVEDQAADRAHRIGQDRPVNVYRMVAKDTVEERVLELQARKRAIADAALGGGAVAAAEITRDEILALLD